MIMTQENDKAPVDALHARINQLEQEKIELQVLLERNRARDAKGNFLHLLSHELRSPLASVNSALELLKEDEVGPLNTNQVEFLEVAINNTRRMIKLIETLFDIARFENGQLRLEKQPVNLKSLLENILNAGLRADFEAKKIGLTLEVASDLVVEADSRRLYQVLDNLLSHACQYTPCQGQVAVRVAAQRNKIEVSIQDSRPGLSEQTMAYLTARTFRLEEFMTRELNYSGLTLTITSCLLALHRSRLRAENRQGGGAVFSFELSTPNSKAPIFRLGKAI
jgi:signal transduction histidine kinase